jgi:transportin-1
MVVVLQVRLSTTTNVTWIEWEVAILALGVVAEGCISGLLLHLSWVPLPLLESIPWF